jgi:hypothetical protein
VVTSWGPVWVRLHCSYVAGYVNVTYANRPPGTTLANTEHTCAIFIPIERLAVAIPREQHPNGTPVKSPKEKLGFAAAYHCGETLQILARGALFEICNTGSLIYGDHGSFLALASLMSI